MLGSNKAFDLSDLSEAFNLSDAISRSFISKACFSPSNILAFFKKFDLIKLLNASKMLTEINKVLNRNETINIEQARVQMKPCSGVCAHCAIILDDMCLHRGLARACMNVYFETRVVSDLLIVESIVFGWSKNHHFLTLS